MKKFKYRLESLLKVKEHIEKQRQKDLAVAAHKVMKQKDQINSLLGNRKNKIDKQRGLMTGSLSVGNIQSYSRFLAKLRVDHITSSEMLKVLKKGEDQKRNELIEAAKERRVYERLKEKQQEQFLKEFKRLESLDNDETAVVTYRRTKSKTN